jgi:hypothetical protein
VAGHELGKGLHLGTAVLRPALGPPSFLNNSNRRLCLLGLKQLEREADHFPTCNAEVKMREVLVLLPLYAFMARCLGTGSYLP